MTTSMTDEERRLNLYKLVYQGLESLDPNRGDSVAIFVGLIAILEMKRSNKIVAHDRAEQIIDLLRTAA